MKISVVTNCTGRKAFSPNRQLIARFLPAGTAKEVAGAWRRRIKAADHRVPANRLYQGRGFCEAVLAAGMTRNALHIVSAGVGFISEIDLVPAYHLTTTRGHPDSILKKIGESQAVDWWGAINAVGISKNQLSDWIGNSHDTVIVLALTPNYLALISSELCALPSKDLERVRIVGVREKSQLAGALKELAMPYDSRLNGRDSPIRGTESDFPQRAARHFVNLIQDKRVLASPSRHAQLVRRTLDGWRYRVVPARKRLSEIELQKAVRDAWNMSAGRWTVALRILRSDLNIACEQGRFRKLCQSIGACGNEQG